MATEQVEYHPYQRGLIRNALCAICGENPAQCVNEIQRWVGPRAPSLEELMSGVGEVEPCRQAMAVILVPTCGVCYDQVTNEQVERFSIGGGLDFRDHYECDHPYHDPDSGVEGVPIRVLPGDTDGRWVQYGCPYPLCCELLPDQLHDDTGSREAGQNLLSRLIAGLDG